MSQSPIMRMFRQSADAARLAKRQRATAMFNAKVNERKAEVLDGIYSYVNYAPEHIVSHELN